MIANRKTQKAGKDFPESQNAIYRVTKLYNTYIMLGESTKSEA